MWVQLQAESCWNSESDVDLSQVDLFLIFDLQCIYLLRAKREGNLRVTKSRAQVTETNRPGKNYWEGLLESLLWMQTEN